MSSSLDQIVQVTISQQTQAVPQVSFSIPAIFGPSDVQDELLAYYSSLNAVAEAGYESSDPEYIRAQEAFSQDLVPTQIAIGKYTEAVEQEDTFAVNTLGASGAVYGFTLDGTPITHTQGASETQQSILTALLAAIATAFPSNPPVEGVVEGTGGSALLTLTATEAGDGIAYSAINTKLTHVETVENHSIVDDIIAAQETVGGNLWYGLSICSQVAADIKQVAAYIETQLKIFIADSHDSDILTSVTTDIASVLKGRAYDRTAVMYAGTANDGRAAGWLGGQLPQVPGASTWKFKTIAGIDPDDLTDTQRTRCIGIPGTPGKNCNIYETVGGVPITEEGFMASGQFIDITVGIDWLVSTMQTNVFSQLVNTPKIPYTDQGVGVIENAIRQTIQQGVANGLIDGASPITVEAPLVLNISANDRANRILPDVTFSCRLAGAFHFIQIQGTVTV